jgi:hypothetical protein
MCKPLPSSVAMRSGPLEATTKLALAASIGVALDASRLMLSYCSTVVVKYGAIL